MKKITILFCLLATLVAMATPPAFAQETTEVLQGKVVSIAPDQITIATPNGERTFTMKNNVVLRNAENLSEIEEGMPVFLRIVPSEELCIVINAQR